MTAPEEITRKYRLDIVNWSNRTYFRDLLFAGNDHRPALLALLWVTASYGMLLLLLSEPFHEAVPVSGAIGLSLAHFLVLFVGFLVPYVIEAWAWSRYHPLVFLSRDTVDVICPGVAYGRAETIACQFVFDMTHDDVTRLWIIRSPDALCIPIKPDSLEICRVASELSDVGMFRVEKDHRGDQNGKTTYRFSDFNGSDDFVLVRGVPAGGEQELNPCSKSVTVLGGTRMTLVCIPEDNVRDVHSEQRGFDGESSGCCVIFEVGAGKQKEAFDILRWIGDELVCDSDLDQGQPPFWLINGIKCFLKSEVYAIRRQFNTHSLFDLRTYDLSARLSNKLFP